MNSTLGLVHQFGGFDNPGALAIAEAMSPEPDCATIIGDVEPDLMTELTICQQCFLFKSLDMAILMESTNSSAEALEKAGAL